METKLFYVRSKRNFPVACVATTEFNDEIALDWSTWNPMDEFSKAIAREVAIGRLQRRMSIVEEATSENPMVDPRTIVAMVPQSLGVRKAILTEFANCRDCSVVPTRLREAAKFQLKRLAAIELTIKEQETTGEQESAPDPKPAGVSISASV